MSAQSLALGGLVWKFAEDVLRQTVTAMDMPGLDAADLVIIGWNIEPCEKEDADPTTWTFRIHFAPRKGSPADEAIRAGSIAQDFDLADGPSEALEALTRLAGEVVS